MKHLIKRVLSGLLTVVMVSSILCTAASASVRSSAYLNSYRATIVPKSGGLIVVNVSVDGVGSMTEIGAKTIYIYESLDNKSFYRVGTYESSVYPQMMGSGYDYYRDAVTYLGTPGRYYRASVWVYAANEDGSDEKNYLTASKQAIS